MFGKLSLFDAAALISNITFSCLIGLEDWSEADVLTQVLAASQQEYLDSLKKASQSRRSSSDSNNPSSDTSNNNASSAKQQQDNNAS